MKIIYNRYLPLGTFRAINLLGLVFARSEYGRLSQQICNHEKIHTLQQQEMLFVFFYLWYVSEWLIRLAQYRDMKRAYYEISMEREAYLNQDNLEYSRHRPYFAWRHYLH